MKRVQIKGYYRESHKLRGEIEDDLEDGFWVVHRTIWVFSGKAATGIACYSDTSSDTNYMNANRVIGGV